MRFREQINTTYGNAAHKILAPIQSKRIEDTLTLGQAKAKFAANTLYGI